MSPACQLGRPPAAPKSGCFYQARNLLKRPLDDMYTSPSRLISSSKDWPITKAFHSRKKHTKSRGGCRACKSARLKCDEGKPVCQRCAVRRCLCRYDPSVLSVLAVTTPLLNRPLRPLVLGETDAELWHHFTHHTWTTLADSHTNIVVLRSLGLAFQAEYLKQAVLALAATHRNFLLAAGQIDSSTGQHLAKAIILFRSQIGQKSSASSMDPVLLTSLLLSTQNFFLERHQFSGSWFMGSKEGLSWLTLLSGWRPLLLHHRNWLSTSVWAQTMQRTTSPSCIVLHSSSRPDKSAINSIPNEWRALFRVSEEEDLEHNPYVNALSKLAVLMARDESTQTLRELMTFAHTLDPRLLALVSQRHPLAICVIAMWLGCLCQVDLWWIRDRAQMECYAACEYLQTHSGSIQSLPLEQTARVCGYKLSSDIH
ncbi:hypothetical protein LTR70_010560 [Exophiala xenobiotica]|nr:hypothetical protein LTR70_010560 [Exophiala xenobiotica]